MTALTKHVDIAIRGVRDRFLDRLGERCLEIETLMLAVDDRRPEQRLIKEIAMRAHKTAGISPTLGFKDLGEIALRVESRLSDYVSAGDWPACRQMIEELLDQMEAALDQTL
ncbi:hypothetical protein E2K80_14565 [Rhodophyticola sp. CCM32]|uniref:Hpt domain-containing protein n=1 Tax=Rhodophyticola sp. CCM32 TaxID=2916397 RepID=UPI00107F42DF|nr:Hpt domain-containing protein [Rhodophyticola sp. CCM32]QBY01793.1 hypothetical protein E2K80_14565 [Rhodophyticola sp. CCM32]